MPNSIVFSNPGASIIRWGDGVAVPYLTLSGVPLSGTVGVAVTGFVTNTGSATGNWTIASSPSDVLISPSSGTLAVGATTSFALTALSSGTKSIGLSSSTPGATIAGSPMSFSPVSIAPPPPPPPPPPSSGSPSPFTLTSSTSGTLPFTVGHAFRQGDIPAGSGIAIAGATAQATIKNTWPDGSAKFAILAGSYTSAGSAVTVTPSAGTASTGTALTTTDLIATGVTASIDAGAFGAASFGNTEWAAPFQTWVSGHRMSSWIYRKQIGADAHLVAWLEVRLYLGGAVEVLPWVENGYLNVSGPTIKSATYSFTLGGSSRFSAAIDLRHHQRTPLVSGSLLSHWLGTDSLVVPRHSAAYMQATELVPTYSATVSPAATVVTDLPATYVPLQQGSFQYAFTATNANTGFDRDDMTTGGYGAPIGLLPQHDMLYLTTTADVYATVVRNGYSAGRYQIHYRDETTNRPLRFSSYPTLVMGVGSAFASLGSSTVGNLTPTATGGNGPTWDTAHSPSIGYMAYLLTGRWYFMEEVLFAATANYLGNGDNVELRNGSQGLVKPSPGAWQTRACAWDWRSKVQALTVVPDDDTALRTELINCVESNIAHFHGRYVAQANNPFGFIQSGSTSYDGTTSTLGAFQQDFVTASFGWSVSMDLPIGNTPKANLGAFFQWTAQSIVGRLSAASGSGATGYPYMNAAVYVLSVSSTSVPNYETGAGPWRADWAAVYAALPAALTAASAPNAWINSTPGTLYGEIVPGETSFWGNLLPAISYAVQHGVGGAAVAYNRITAALNYSSLAAAFNTNPVWSVKPASGLTPVWAASAPLNTWMAVPNSAGAGGTAVDAFCGWALRDDTGELFIAAAGGHLNSSDNRVASFSLLADSPSWTTRNAASTSVQVDVPYYLDGKPSSRHTYTHTHWIPSLNRIMLIGARFVYGPMVEQFQTVDGFNPSTNTWDAAGTYPNIQPGYYGVARDSSDRVLCMWGRRIWSAGSTTGSGSASASTDVRGTWCWDSSKSRMFGIAWGDGEGFNSGARAKSVNMATGTITNLTINASAAYTQFEADAPTYAGLTYDSLGDRYFFYGGSTAGQAGRVYVITYSSPTAIDISIWTHGSGGTTLPQSDAGGINGKFTYVPQLSGIVAMPTKAGGAYYMRLA